MNQNVDDALQRLFDGEHRPEDYRSLNEYALTKRFPVSLSDAEFLDRLTTKDRIYRVFSGKLLVDVDTPWSGHEEGKRYKGRVCLINAGDGKLVSKFGAPTYRLASRPKSLKLLLDSALEEVLLLTERTRHRPAIAGRPLVYARRDVYDFLLFACFTFAAAGSQRKGKCRS